MPPRPQLIVDRPAGRNYNSDYYTRKYLDSLLVEMRIVDSTLASTKTTLFGAALNTPVMLGAPGGAPGQSDVFTTEAEAVAETGSVMWVAGRTTAEEIRECVKRGAKVIQVIKPYADNARLIEDLKKAEEAGCFAVASDLDHAYGKDGGYDKQGESVFAPKSSQELRDIVSALNVPFIAKGVLSVQDAVKCKEAGVSGILLSHHHSIMDCAVPPLMILPAIREAVGDDYTIIVDCSIDTGADAFKALALGADAVCTVRAAMKVMAKGKDEIADFLNKMTGELRHFMNRTASPDVKHIDPSVIHQMMF